jgi:hypothetical protein
MLATATPALLLKKQRLDNVYICATYSPHYSSIPKFQYSNSLYAFNPSSRPSSCSVSLMISSQVTTFPV